MTPILSTGFKIEQELAMILFTPLEIIPCYLAAGSGSIKVPTGFHASLGFESRHGGTGISNGIYSNFNLFSPI
jgi:hypothetical protein